jgi:diguanylate cyclase (GGDEF)-like protein
MYINLYCRFCAYLLIVLALAWSQCLSASNVELSKFSEGTLGKYIQYFQEQNTKLSLSEAQYHFTHSKTIQGSSNSISLGIDVAPVWMKFSVSNDQNELKTYRLSIETAWLDNIDAWLLVDGKVIQHTPGGDAYAYQHRPMQYRHYAFEHDFNPGTTDIYLRIESKGPMALPVRLSSKKKAIARDIATSYEYGLLYGIMSALALYNLVLFIFIRQQEYGLYALYLLGFVINSLSYTGQLYTVITYDFGAYFQDWVDIWLMITYSVAGLHFARILLKTKNYAPGLNKLVIRTTQIIPAAMLIGSMFNQLTFTAALAFSLNSCFVILFIAMGIRALQAGTPFAIIFLFSSVTAAVCIAVSTLAVAGFLVPYNDYTFKAIEIGMAFEAFVLAVILARQFQIAKMDKIVAESYARTDALTQLNNRRGFQDISLPIWQNIIREKRQASVVLLDIDNFKKVNDVYGHDSGDKVLIEVAQCISGASRKGDVIARWGGEEFIVFLPETSQAQATVQAERIRSAIEQLSIQLAENCLSVTASFGIADNGKRPDKCEPANNLELLINLADKALYVAKGCGKNQIHAENTVNRLSEGTTG